MGSKTSKLAKQVAKSQARAISPRERMEKMPTLSSGAPTLRHHRGELTGVDMKEQDKFRNDWFPNAHWEQYPVRGDIQEMAQEKPAHAPIRSTPDPTIPYLAEEQDNKDLIQELSFIGRGLTPGPDKSTQFPRLARDESKMPKQRVSLPEKKLKGYLEATQFREVYELSANYTIEELSVKYETQEKRLEEILRYTAWVDQPQTSMITGETSKSKQNEMTEQREKANREEAARMHRPNQGGKNDYEHWYNAGVPGREVPE